MLNPVTKINGVPHAVEIDPKWMVYFRDKYGDDMSMWPDNARKAMTNWRYSVKYKYAKLVPLPYYRPQQFML